MREGSPTIRPRVLSPWSWAPAFLAALVVAIVLIGTSPTGRAPSPSVGAWSVGDHWTNGVVTAEFVPTAPAVTVASVWTEPGYGLYAGLGGLGEYSPSGAEAASADFSGAHWAVRNASDSQELQLDYAATLPVSGGSGGHVSVEVNFTSGAAGGPAGVDSGGVSFTVAAQGWPWVSNSDSLGLLFPLWPNDTNLEHLSEHASGMTLNCLANDSGVAQEYFGWSGPASARGPTGQLAALTPAAVVSGNPQYDPLVVMLTGAPGGYSSLSYDPELGILGLVGAPSVPVTGLGIVFGATGGGLLLAALLLGRVQLRVPGLERVEEAA
ncbi:MAG: hypothetical protein L3K13_01800 [Thermoplasmata archaeon]|nr:hypothetical protein [Thermoplasmata archaeon]